VSSGALHFMLTGVLMVLYFGNSFHCITFIQLH